MPAGFVVTTQPDQKIEAAIAHAYHTLGHQFGDDPLVAIRTPGQTLLNVSGASQVIASVRNLFVNQDNSVLIHAMINPVSAGLVTTGEPIAVEAIYGLGAPRPYLTPDRYHLDPHTFKVIKQTIASQPWRLEYHRGRHRHLSLPAQQARGAKLHPATLLELARLGNDMEQRFHLPLAIEWAVDYQGRIWIISIHSLPGTLPGTPRVNLGAAGNVGRVLAVGKPAGAGAATGPVVIVHKPADLKKVKLGNILVTERLFPGVDRVFDRITGLVCDTGRSLDHKLPAVLAAGHASHLVKDGQIVTVDGTGGVVYKGKVSDIGYQMSDIRPTSTKVYLHINEPISAFRFKSLPVDGITARAPLPLGDLAHLAAPRPVLYHLSGINQPPQSDQSNIQFILKKTRTYSELKQAVSLLPDHRLWLSVSTPAAVTMIDELLGAGIDGVVIDLQDLIGHYGEAIHRVIVSVADHAHGAGKATLVIGDEASLQPEVVETAVLNDVTGICAPPEHVLALRNLITSIESMS